jgi:hypothetical protein
MRHSYLSRLVSIAIALWPVSALADVGTPLVWGMAFHLFLGNALLGLLEGWLLARVFGLSAKRCAWWLVVANYLSAWCGMMLMGFLFERYATDIYSGLRISWLLVAGTYVLTLIIEWPFVAACFRGTQRWLTASVKGSLLVQSASYICLFGGYWLLSGTSLYTTMDVVSPTQMTRPSGVAMFFISAADGDVYRTDLSGSADIKVADLASTDHWHDHLELRACPADTNYWDLAVVGERREAVVVWPRLTSQQQVPQKQAWRTTQYNGWGVGAFQVGDATNSIWSLGWTHWPDLGMWARDGSHTVRIAYGLPFGGWTPYRVVHLPHDQALLQLGRQICLVDIPGRKIAMIKMGYGALAFHEDQIVESGGPANGSQSICSETNSTLSAAGSDR